MKKKLRCEECGKYIDKSKGDYIQSGVSKRFYWFRAGKKVTQLMTFCSRKCQKNNKLSGDLK